MTPALKCPGPKPKGRLKTEKEWNASNPFKRRKKKGSQTYQGYHRRWWECELERRANQDEVRKAAAAAGCDDDGPAPVPL